MLMNRLDNDLSAGAKNAQEEELHRRKARQVVYKATYAALPTAQKARYARALSQQYYRSQYAEEDKKEKSAGGGSTTHAASSGRIHGGSHGSFGTASPYGQRQRQKEEARREIFRRGLDLIGTAASQAQRGVTGTSVSVEQQLAESRRQADNVRAIREAKASFDEANTPIEWDGRSELVSELERIDSQAGWEISEAQANEAERRRQELLSRLREGDLAAGNGVRSGTDADTGRDVVESTGKGIVGSGANLVSNVGKNLERIDAYSPKPFDAVSDLINGEQLGSSRQRRIEAYEDPSSQEKWAGLDAFADRMDYDSAALLQRAKEGKSLAGEFGVDVAKGALEMGFDTSAAALTGGSALVPMGMRTYGESVGRARRADATLEQQTAYALTNTAIEVTSEKLFDGVARIYGAGAADDIVERLVGRMAESDAGRTTLRMIAGAAGEGTEELVSDLLAPLAESTYRSESVGELYRQLDPVDLLHDYLVGGALGTVGGAVSIATGQNTEANRALRAQDAAEQAYLDQMERLGHIPPESGENAAPDGAAEKQSLIQRVKAKLSNVVGKERADIIRGMSFGEQIAGIENDLISRQEKPFTTVRNTTPDILVRKAGAEQLPVIMSYESAYLSAKADGSQTGHYHKLGAELMDQIPAAMEHPLAIIRQKNGRIAEILDLKDKIGNNIYLSIELSATKDIDGKNSAYNLIITAFGAKENYIKGQLNEEGNDILESKLSGD